MMIDTGHFSDLAEALERDALTIDRTGDATLVHMLFRTAHNLKSSTVMAGCEELAQEVHRLEDQLDKIRRGQGAWGTRSFDEVMRVVDLVRTLAAGGIATPAGAPAATPSAPSRWGLPLGAGALAACDQAVSAGQGIYRIDKLFRRGLSREAFQGLPVMEDVRELGSLIAIHPGWEAYDAGPEEQVVQILFASPRGAAALADIIFDPLLTLQAPVAAPHPDPQPAPLPLVPTPGPAPATRPGPMRLLIVEDDPTVGHLYQFILKQHALCELATSGEEGLVRFHRALDRGEGYDMVLLDLLLPGMHGDELLRAVREIEFQRGIHEAERRCAVVIATASEDLDQLMRSLNHDPDGYLIKPVDMEVLLAKVAAVKAAHGIV